MANLRRLKPLLALLALGILSLAFPAAGRGAELSKAPLSIRTADGIEHRFTVELASTEPEREQGLMFRTTLAPDAGMLFDFKEVEPVVMWMKDTNLPLDMLFIAKDGRIIRIAERTVPFSLTMISSGGAVLGVLELNGGTAARLKIKPGDLVIHPIFER
jgi:uncharacterized membrane protein (UPF0127 family)